MDNGAHVAGLCTEHKLGVLMPFALTKHVEGVEAKDIQEYLSYSIAAWTLICTGLRWRRWGAGFWLP